MMIITNLVQKTTAVFQNEPDERDRYLGVFLVFLDCISVFLDWIMSIGKIIKICTLQEGDGTWLRLERETYMIDIFININADDVLHQLVCMVTFVTNQHQEI